MKKLRVNYKTEYIDISYLSASSLLEELNKAIAKYGAENVSVGARLEYDVTTAHLECHRPWTALEEEEAAAQAARALQYRRQQYENLKKEFEK